MVYALYLMDKEHGNPHRHYVNQGKPVFPSKDVFRKMRQNEVGKTETQ